MINYAENIFTRTYIHDNKKLYATFHPEVIIEREEYEPTGRYLVVLLHPNKGLQSFFMNKNDETNMWVIDDESGAIVEDELIEWCNYQIVSQRDKTETKKATS
jgi:hypothetical protein